MAFFILLFAYLPWGRGFLVWLAAAAEFICDRRTRSCAPLKGTDEEYIAAAERLLDTVPEADRHLIGFGRRWLAQYRKTMERLQSVCDAEERFVCPEPSQAMFWRESDAELGVEAY